MLCKFSRIFEKTMKKYKPRFNASGIDNSCISCQCKQGEPLKKDKSMCKCGHSHFNHRMIFNNWPKEKLK